MVLKFNFAVGCSFHSVWSSTRNRWLASFLLLQKMASNSQQQDRFYVVNRNQADVITDVQVHSCESSRYLKPLRLKYKQNGASKSWDYLKVHDSVAILLYNTDREVFILVRQFRPAVYAVDANAVTEGQGIDTSQHPGASGMTYELCAGIVDKQLGLKETAQAELLEETGYDVPLDRIKQMMAVRSSVGMTGSKQTLFYAEVTDSMKSLTGGGLPQEGECIEVIELPKHEADHFLWDETLQKPVGLIAAFLWFFREKRWFQKEESECNT